jgi:hypothetical protein
MIAVPIAFKNEIQSGQKVISILAADIGGTKTNVAFMRPMTVTG